MANRKKSSKKTTASQRAETKERKTAKNNANRQMLSIIWFAIAVFLLFIVLIPGESAWLFLHNSIFGIFGVTAFIYPVLLGFIAVMYALDKFYGSIYAKVIESVVLIIFIGAAVDVFTQNSAQEFFGAKIEEIPFMEYMKNSFVWGQSLKNGGFLGALISLPLSLLFGHTGASITIILLIVVLLMLITGTTLIALFKALANPVQKISKRAEDSLVANFEKNNDKEVYKKAKERSSVDIPVDDIPERRVTDTSSLDEKQKKLVESYTGFPLENSQEITNALKKTAQEEKGQQKLKADKQIEEEIVEEINKNQTETSIIFAEEDSYKFPPITLLNPPVHESADVTGADLDSTAAHLVDTLRSFGVETRIVDISRGPTVTRYELQPCAGVKISKITNLADDIALNLATAGVRIEAPIPNKAAVGIEVPNKTSNVVGIREIIESPMFTNSKSKLTIALGRDIGGNVIVGDIAKMPHGLIAGVTGSGKSVCINSIIVSILYKASPDEVKLLMIDPKVVELGRYNGIPHLMVPVVTDPRKAAGALGWAVGEMEKRYRIFAENMVRDLDSYNKLAEKEDNDLEKLSQVVIIIDELADLMMTAPGEVEDSINRIAAKARAAGMHLLIATQRPSVDVITGVIKANIPSRIAFAVSSQVDSRTILDGSGAEKLLGRGDMLFHPIGAPKPSRLQGCYVSDEELDAVVDYVKSSHKSDYDETVIKEIERQAVLDKGQKRGISDDVGEADDPMLNDAIETFIEFGQASTSLLQRKLKLGYARAARLVDVMEERGIVGPYEGSKPRQVLISKEAWLERQAREE